MISETKNTKWFNVENYTLAQSFTARDWEYALDLRIIYSLVNQLSPTTHDQNKIAEYEAKRLRFWEQIRKQPIFHPPPVEPFEPDLVAIKKDDPVLFPLRVGDVLYATRGDPVDYPHVTIHDITRNDLFYWFDGKVFSDLASDARRLEETRGKWISDYQRGDRSTYELMEGIERKNRVPVRNDDRFVIEVDLSASSEQILEEFSQWLGAQKNDLQKSRTRSIGQEEFDGWVAAKILPYFDLINIAAIDGVKLSNHKIGDLLFPDEIEVDVAERVRKVTRPKAERIFTMETTEVLSAQTQAAKKRN